MDDDDEGVECPFCGGNFETPFHKLTPWHLFMLFICQLFRFS